MKTAHISFIGGGNMAASLIGGLVAGGYAARCISVSEPDPARLKQLQERWPVNATSDNRAAVDGAGVVVLAVKPQVLPAVAKTLAADLRASNPLVISIAAGIRSEALRHWLGESIPLVRAMPNTPALVQTGATGLFATAQVSDEQRDLAESILRAVGITVWVDDEDLMDVVTALSGSGPAYFFLMMEVLQNAAVTLGLPPATARLLTLQTALGAAKMALESSEDSATLRARVTSPGGTTERALQVLESADLDTLFLTALRAAHERSRELAKLLGEQ